MADGKGIVVIPAYNEAATIADVVSRAEKAGYRVIVCDDASEDDTASLAEKAGATVLTLPVHLGAWVAAQAGITQALAQDARFVVTLDADGQHPPEHIDRLRRAYDEGGGDVIIGSFPPRASRARHLSWAFFRLLTGLNVLDLTSGFRLYGRKAARELITQEAAMTEFQDIGILLLLRRRGYAMSEVGVLMEARKTGKSHVFFSWPRVLYYLCHTAMLACSRR